MATTMLSLVPCAVPAFRAITHRKPTINWLYVAQDAITHGDIVTVESALNCAMCANQSIDWSNIINQAGTMQCPIDWKSIIDLANENRHFKLRDVVAREIRAKSSIPRALVYEFMRTMYACIMDDDIERMSRIIRDVSAHGTISEIDWQSLLCKIVHMGSIEMLSLVAAAAIELTHSVTIDWRAVYDAAARDRRADVLDWSRIANRVKSGI